MTRERTRTASTPSPASPVGRPDSRRGSPTRRNGATARRASFAPASRSVVAVLLVVVGLYATGALASERARRYRTATAGRHDVDSVLTGVGVLEPVSQATVAFPVSGTVATVSVDERRHGHRRTAAREPRHRRASRRRSHEKQATLAQAELTLHKALNGESVTPSGGGNIRTGIDDAPGTVAATSC